MGPGAGGDRGPGGLGGRAGGEQIFEEQLLKGATAFRVAPDAPAQRLDRFDPEAEQVVVVPRVVGG